MKNLKIAGIVASILSLISAICGICIVCYYVDDMFVRALYTGLLIVSSTVVSYTVGSIFRQLK
ncbi:hypothetical protein GNF68_14220 [Clostridium perfringens]|uniref:Lipoprotein n=1 Tax=Clostridium perfringens TaxID=1502 RepID=A0AAW9I0N9_CLOPF|nr:hypothetical protein [Clostridium perfringens]MDZ4910188.1 hypothetical protein [Clostridium perfringens]